MSVFGASIRRINLVIMSLFTSDTCGGITTYIEHSEMPTPGQPMLYSPCAMFTEDSKGFDIFPGSWANFRNLSSSIQCSWACISTPRHQQKVNPCVSHAPPSQTPRSFSPVLQSTSRCSQPPWSFAKCSQVLQELSQVLLKVPAVLAVHSGCYKI
jgi:hypothetical protein